MKVVNNFLSATPPFAAYCSVTHSHTEHSSAYKDMCNMGNLNVVSKAKKFWHFDMRMSQDYFQFMSRAIQIELLHYYPTVGVRISQFEYTCYLMFLCYHGLGQYDNRNCALRQLVDTANDPQRCGHICHHSYNIAGHCLLIAGHTEMSRELF